MPIFRLALSAVAFATLSLAACASAPPAAPIGPSAGRDFALRACAGCHALSRAQLSPEPHAPPFPAMAARFPGGDLEMALSGVAQRGHIEMPPIYMTPAEIRAVAAYIRQFESQTV